MISWGWDSIQERGSNRADKVFRTLFHCKHAIAKVNIKVHLGILKHLNKTRRTLVVCNQTVQQFPKHICAFLHNSKSYCISDSILVLYFIASKKIASWYLMQANYFRYRAVLQTYLISDLVSTSLSSWQRSSYETDFAMGDIK